MTPAKKVSLATLVQDDLLERIPVDPEVCRNLLRQADNHLRTATAGITEQDTEGAFQLAYDACRKACLALILATGVRPKGAGAHITTFEAAAAIAASFNERAVVDDAADLRFVRNNTEYRAEMIDQQDAEDSITIGRQLVAALAPNIEKIFAALDV